MKKISFIICIFVSFRLSAQVTTDPATGNVGINIGTSTINARLDIRQPIVTNGISTVLLAGYGGLVANRSFSFQQLGNTNTATQYFFMNGGLGSGSLLGSPTLTSMFTPTFGFESNDNSLNILVAPMGTNMAPTRAMTVIYNGNIGIGTSSPGSSKLAVEGTISARKVVVTLANPFPDYVFKKQYKLLPLDSLERYIKTESHLPGMPSADSVEKSGLDLGNNQELLLKKIEELTLYAIDQQRRLDKLVEENQAIKKELKAVKKRIK
jgi:hypothetical protein